MIRTHTCGDLTGKDEGKPAVLQGWVHTRRDHGGVIFIDLRDRYGLSQIVFNPDHADFEAANKLRREDVIEIHGKVRSRPEGMKNPNLKTGEIEVLCEKLVILNKSEVPPIEIDDRISSNEEMRLKYRYLDLRRPSMQNKFIVRHKAAQAAREFLSSHDFLEIETPLLIKSTPEGARDYIVPSRVNPGKFYALPQSPQLYKQILMVSGFDRYFQLARCLRDEDLRADRQPEFTQIDVEMSFATHDDIFLIGEGLMKHVFKKAIDTDIKTPFVKMTYEESMEKYGCDKPDLRYDLHLTDVSDIVKDSDFSVFKEIVSKGGIVKCINPEHDFSRNDIDGFIKYAQAGGAKGMAWMRLMNGKLESNIVKFFNEDIQKKLIERMHAKSGYLFFIADKPKITNKVLDLLRRELAKKMNLIKENDFKFLWVTDFPLFERNEEEDRWEAAHHMFTMPKKEDLEFLESDPSKVHADCYDLVLNGIEIASGSVRIHDPKIQEKVMKIVGITHEEANEKFGFLLEAFKYGAPPHAGFAPGFDRLVALMLGTNDIREVIAFPKNKSAECPMDDSPSIVEDKILKELNLKVDIVKKKD